MELPKGFNTTPQSKPIYENLLKRIRTVVPEDVSFAETDRVVQLIKDAGFKSSVTASMFRFIKMFDEVKCKDKYNLAQQEAEAFYLDTKPELVLPSTEQIVEKFEQLQEVDETSRDSLIVGMYVLMPAMRPSTWVNLSFEHSKDSNWYDVENRLLYINKQKSKSAGKIVIRVHEYLADLIYFHHENWDINNNNIIYRTLKRCLGVTPTQMRKVWTRHLETLPVDQKFIVRRIMGHTVNTSKTYYTK
jgi:hypothetical protein